MRDSGDKNEAVRRAGADVRNALYSVSYISRCRIPPWELTEQLDDIERTAVSRNEAAGLTGKLIYRHGHFIQRLEGPKHLVDETMDRIRNDHRHDNIKVLAHHPIKKRMYSSWQQLHVVMEGPELAELDSLLGLLCSRPVQSADDAEVAVMLTALQNIPTSSKQLLPDLHVTQDHRVTQ